MTSPKQHLYESLSEGEFQFLIAKYLQTGPFQDVGLELIRKLNEQKALPKRVDWLGNEHYVDFEELDNSYTHVDPDYLFKIAGHVGQVLDEGNRYNNVEGIRSLLSSATCSRLDPLRSTEESRDARWRTHQLLYSRNPAANRCVPSAVSATGNYPELPHLTTARQIHGSLPPEIMYSRKYYSGFQLHKRLLGHLAAAFNVIYDRTGKFLITGSDDRLLKLWSAIDGRLLFSFRGHSAEVVIITINDENTMLASVATDRTIRIWDLETGTQMVVHKHPTGFISSLKFSPSVRGKMRFLVASSMDGTVTIWKYDSDTLKFFATGEAFINEKTAEFPQTKICSISFTSGGTFLASGSADGVVRVYNLLADGGPKKILQRRLHDDRVDSVEYCHVGDRLLTGSRDGTGRVWIYKRQEFSTMMLNSAQSLSVSGSDKHDPRSYKRKVTMVGWSRNDQYAIMASDDHVVRVFDSFSGNLVFELTGHSDCVYVLESHPFDTNVYLTAGHDAKLILWSLIDGSIISIYSQWIDGHGPAPFVDAKWNPDGNSFAASDMFGSLNIYGLGKGTAFLKTPTEQFFHTDYRPLMKDVAGFVIDEQTQLSPNAMQPPFLVNAAGAPYPPDIQRMVPGRFGFAALLQVPVEPLPALDAALNALNNQALLPGVGNADGAPAPADPSPVIGVQYVTKKDHFHRVYVPKPMDPMLVQSFIRKKTELAKMEVERFTEQSQLPKDKKSLDFQFDLVSVPQPRVLKSDDSVPIPLAVDQPGNAVPEAHLPPAPQNGLILPDIDEDSEDEDYDSEQADELSDAESLSEADDISIASVEARLIQNGHTRGSNGHATRRSKRKRITHSESDLEFEASEIKDDEYDELLDETFDGPSTSRGPQKKPKKQATIPAAPKRSYPLKERNQKVTSKKPTKKPPTKSKLKKEDFIQVGPNIDASTPKWLTETLPKRSPYFPQVGDEVYYFIEGHKMFVDAIKKEKKAKVAGINLPYAQRNIKKLVLQPLELLRVKALKFVLTPVNFVRVAVLTVERVQQVPDVLNEFEIRFFEESGVEDFLILKQFVEESLKLLLCTGMRVRSLFFDSNTPDTACNWYNGTIIAISEQAYENNAYNSVTVKWDPSSPNDEGDPQTMSPWDLFPVQDEALENGSRAVTREEIKNLAYRPEPGEWPEDLEAISSRILPLLAKAAEASFSEFFNSPVDFGGTFADYQYLIPYPCDLSLIQQRIQNRFYRRQSALLFDIEQIAANSEIYNGPQSIVTKNAHILAQVCTEIVIDESVQTSITTLVKKAKSNWEAEFKKDRAQEKKEREDAAVSACLNEALEDLSDEEEAVDDDDDEGSMFSPDAEESDEDDVKETVKPTKKCSSISEPDADGSSENEHSRQAFRRTRPKRMAASAHAPPTQVTPANRPQRATTRNVHHQYRDSSEESETPTNRKQANKSVATKRVASSRSRQQSTVQNRMNTRHTNGEPLLKKSKKTVMKVERENSLHRQTRSGRSAVPNYKGMISSDVDESPSPATSTEATLSSTRSSMKSRSESVSSLPAVTTRLGRSVKPLQRLG